MSRVFNRKQSILVRRKLRGQMPAPEAILWSKLRGKQFHGFRFRRQYSVGRYVVDFYCPERKLAIELDGDSHYIGDAPAQDAARDDFIRACGITIIRYTNQDVQNNLSGVLTSLTQHLQSLPPPPSH